MKRTNRTLYSAMKVLLVLVFVVTGILLTGPAPALAQGGDCHIGSPQCTPMAANGVVPVPNPSMVRIAHRRGDGASYYVGENIYIYMYHATGGYVYVYDWQPYMGNSWARHLWTLYLPGGYTRVAVARVTPPTGPEWLTIYDPYSGAYDRTYFNVVASQWPGPGPGVPPWPWSEGADSEHDMVLEFDNP